MNLPALFLLDNNEEIYVWQGWFDNTSFDEKSNDVNATISTKIRFNESRKCALETAICYWNTKYSKSKPFKGYIVYAGVEPIEFRNLFPYWQTNEIARSCNLNVSYALLLLLLLLLVVVVVVVFVLVALNLLYFLLRCYFL